jgi:hypothetical protein
MPATKEQDTMLIEGVYGPNDYGFYDIKAKGSTGPIKLGTKLTKLSDAARGAVGQYVVVTFSSKQKGEYMNYYLEGIGPSGDDIDAPAPVAAPSEPVKSSKDISIARQCGLKCAVWALGPIGDTETVNEYVIQALALSERFAYYFLHGVVTERSAGVGDSIDGDDEIPFAPTSGPWGY